MLFHHAVHKPVHKNAPPAQAASLVADVRDHCGEGLQHPGRRYRDRAAMLSGAKRDLPAGLPPDGGAARVPTMITGGVMKCAAGERKAGHRRADRMMQNGGVPADDDILALRDSCTRFLHWHGPVRAADLLATVPAESVIDRYGEGGVVAELEGEIARLLGKAAAVFVPSGTMAQQAVLRVHADRRQRRTIVFHPACHIDRHEGRGYERLHRLVGRPAGEQDRLLTVGDLRGVAEPPAVLVLELPQRDLGGQQPSWDDLRAQVEWGRGAGAAVHLDGARLWESAAGYGQPPSVLADLFDTVYVSFYKGLGALPGCCVAGPDDVIAEVREWRHRMGGTLFGMWPSAASALTCLSQRLPLMPRYLRHTRAIADALRDLPGVQVLPDPPQTPMLHLLLHTTQQGFADAARRLAKEQGVWTWPQAMTTGDPAMQRVELAVGDATSALEPAEIRGIVATLVTA